MCVCIGVYTVSISAVCLYSKAALKTALYCSYLPRRFQLTLLATAHLTPEMRMVLQIHPHLCLLILKLPQCIPKLYIRLSLSLEVSKQQKLIEHTNYE